MNEVLAGSQRLNRSLTELGRRYAERKEQMHLTPAACRRVVDAALGLANQPRLVVEPSPDTAAVVLRVPALDRSWDGAVQGLAPLLHPDQPRPITFDESAADVPGLVHVHLGHPLLRKATRTLRANLFSPQSAVHRITAVVMPGIEESYAVSVSRLVLVGRGGLRLHEQVFVTGVRLRGSRVAEDTVNEVLDRVLDPGQLVLAPEPVRDRLVADWQADGAHLRTRLDEETRRRAERLQNAVSAQLNDRRQGDTKRVHGIYAAFRANLTYSLERMRAEERTNQDMLASWLDEQRAQRERDMRAMIDRLEALDDEERREADAVARRYEDVRPFVASVGLVFAVAERDAAEWESRR